MSLRFVRLVSGWVLPLLVGGCDVWGTIYSGCDVTYTCPSEEDAGVDASVIGTYDSGADSAGSPSDATVDSRSLGEAGSDEADRVEPDGPRDGETEPDVHFDGADAGCDRSRSPADAPCTISEAFGVFVSPSAASENQDGTRERPFSSLSVALQSASATGKRVYACDDGTGHAGPISIGPSADGIKVFGGFECSAWTYDTTRRAKLTASTSPTLTVTHLVTGVVLENLEIIAQDATNPSQSSIGIGVTESAGVVLRRVRVTVGKGKDGVNGDNGGGATNDGALAGAEGNHGHNACTASPNLGGFAVYTTCGAMPSGTSGGGGDGAINSSAKADNGGDGSPPYAAGKGGAGEPVSGLWSCSTGRGQDGDNGADGPAGASGAGLGSLTVSGWKGTDGIDGNPGQPGQGGGGGGGAKAPNACTAPDGGVLSPTGASGGGGGSGGCGGNGGKAGTAGGSSIALVSIGSDVTLDTCELAASDGGKGGNGGQGQSGGIGGQPGIGGVGTGNPQSNPACAGGQGGKGGNGGPGGGGIGGHSLGVAYQGKAPTGLVQTTVKVGAKGTGGQPGSGTGKGDDGLAAVSVSFDANDAGK